MEGVDAERDESYQEWMRGLAEERSEMELKVRAAAAILKPRGDSKEWGMWR